MICANNINPYLIDGPDVLVESRGNPICDVPKMTAGNKPSDGGHLILSAEEKDRPQEADESFGLWGTIQRIRMYTGKRDCVKIESEPGEYTRIEITIGAK